MMMMMMMITSTLFACLYSDLLKGNSTKNETFISCRVSAAESNGLGPKSLGQSILEFHFEIAKRGRAVTSCGHLAMSSRRGGLPIGLRHALWHSRNHDCHGYVQRRVISNSLTAVGE